MAGARTKLLGTLAIPANNGSFGDTAPDLVKQLRVDYTVNGQPGSQTVGEGEVLTIAAPGANPLFAKSFCAALPGAAPAVRCGLLRLLRYAGGPEAIAAVQTATADADPVIKDTALRVLCDWPTADAVPALAKFLKGAPEAKFKILALRGYLRLIPLLTVTSGEKLAAVVEALGLADRDEEKKLALAALAAIPTPEALAVADTFVGAGTLSEEACLTAVRIATAIKPPRAPAVAATLRKVVEKTASEEIRKSANALLNQP